MKFVPVRMNNRETEKRKKNLHGKNEPIEVDEKLKNPKIEPENVVLAHGGKIRVQRCRP